jgi:cytoskeletal protein CcmA (bactofilin family)
MAKADIEEDSLESSNEPEVKSGASKTPSAPAADTGEVHAAPDQQAPAKKTIKAGKGKNLLLRITQKINIYLLLFIMILIISGAVLVILAVGGSKKDEPKIASQSISSETLRQLAEKDTTIGDPKQVLNVQSNAIFTGKVLVRDDLDVAGQLKVNGSLSLPGVTVAGSAMMDQVQINKNLSAGGDANIQGQLSVKKGMSVSGNAAVGGTLTANQIATSGLQLIGDLTLTTHVVAGGPTPGRSNGASIGAGGTASVSGSDTGGTININTGTSPSVGCYVTVSFVKKYNSTPRVIISPTNSGAAVLDYYVTRSTTSFSLCAAGASAPASNSTYSFDYIIIG